MKGLLVTGFFFVLNVFAHAQQKTNSIWQTIQLPVKLSKKLSLHSDAGYRTLGISVQPRQFLVRTGLRYHFSKQTDVAVGIASFHTRTSLQKSDHEFGGEFRLWQEVQQQAQLLKHTRVVLRIRTEQRFFEATSKTDGFDAYRFRYRAMFQQEVNRHLQLQVGFEYMHQLTRDVNVFNQYRIQPSFLWKLNKRAQLQIMYMIIKTPGEMQRVVWMTWMYNIN